MLARASLTIEIVPYVLPMPLIGCGAAALPVWVDIPMGVTALVGSLIAFRVRMRLTRRPPQV
jgi:hypothetical protein